MSGGDVFRQGAERKKSAGVASLRGQGTPAYPARLRSERARNSSKTLRAASARNSLKIFPAAGPRNRSRIFSSARPKIDRQRFPPRGRKAVQELLFTQVRESIASLACGFFAAAKDRAAVNQEAGDFPSIETFFHGRGITWFSSPRRIEFTFPLRCEGIRSARSRQPRRWRLRRAARCAARARGSGHVPVRPE